MHPAWVTHGRSTHDENTDCSGSARRAFAYQHEWTPERRIGVLGIRRVAEIREHRTLQCLGRSTLGSAARIAKVDAVSRPTAMVAVTVACCRRPLPPTCCCARV